MSVQFPEPFVYGVSEVPSIGPKASSERKSRPLAALQPAKDRYLTVDRNRYLDPAEMKREWERLWPKVWLCAGRVSDLPTVGSWFRFDIGPESFIIVRSGPDEISALYNVCQHRGNRIVDEAFGRRPAFVCPYHSWTYDLRGRNKRITDRETFDPRALCGELNMPRAKCETWAGNVFINMDENAPPLSEYLNEVMDVLEAYQMEDLHVVQDVMVSLDCNWKVILDAFSEAYHVHMTHAQALPVTEDLKLQFDFYKYGHSRQIVPLGLPSSRWGEVNGMNAGLEWMLQDAGVDPATFTGTPYDVRREVQLAKRKYNTYGVDYSRYSDNQLSDDWAMNIFPNLQWNVHPEGILMQRYYPHPTDAAKCTLHIMVLSPKLAEGKRPPAYMGVPPDADISGKTRPERRYVRADDPNLKELIGELLWQDVRNTRECQLGMASRAFDRVRFCEQEQRNQHQFAEMDRYLDPEMAALPR